MFLYKLKKVLRENYIEIFKGSFMMAFIAAFLPFFALLFINQDDFSKSDKKQMIFVSIVCTVVDCLMISFVDSTFGFSILVSMFLGSFLSFLLFSIPCLSIILYFELSELQLDKSEIREAKLNRLFRKLF